MAAVANPQLVNISINDVELQVPKGEMIVESVKRLGLEIPIFCYHPRLKPVGMCRMCLVEMGSKMPDGTIRKFPKPQTACSLPASEGLVIYTDSAQIHKDRKGVLEFLLINHPLDCPICDRGGECPLQNNTLFYGPSTSRYVEMKRHAAKAFPLSKYVTLDLERCIQCGRCVRFTEEISGDAQLAFRFRGAAMQPSTFQLTEFESKFSGNVIEICPVGALTSTKYRFRARPWDLQTRPGVCTLCSNGCNIHVDHRQNEVVRINGRTHEGINEEWTCDKGKFGHYVFNEAGRLTQVLTRDGASLRPSAWAAAFSEILGRFRKATNAVLVSSALSNEDLFAVKSLFQGELSADVDFRFERDLSVAGTTVSTPIEAYETAESVLIFGTSLADEEPIVYLRVRKGWLNHGTKVVVAHSETTDADGFATAVLRYLPGTEAALANGLKALAEGTGNADEIAAATGVSLAALNEAVASLASAKVITTRGLLNAEGGAQAAAALAAIPGAEFNLYARRANEEGAVRLGLQRGRNTHQILEACERGEVKNLWLAGIDLFAEFADWDRVIRALENVEFLVVQDWHETETTAFASVVLPMTAPTEAEGSYVNVEGRLQVVRAVLPAQGEAKPAWKVANEIGLRLRPATPLFNAREVLARIAEQNSAFAAASSAYENTDGVFLGIFAS
jgi:NADH-quinone oxidoreductase subunit G